MLWHRGCVLLGDTTQKIEGARQLPDAVILVHGLWMHGLVFAFVRRRLARRGFAVAAFSYPTVRGALADNAAALGRYLDRLDAQRIHLVGHSLGGLVVLRLLADRADSRLGRVVLMGSPYAGSHSATALRRLPLLARLVGRSLADWLDAPRPTLPPAIEIGVIAGDRSIGLGRVIPGLPKPNDGVVAVAETRLPSARDAIVLPVAHSQMLVSRRCTEAVENFLRNGNFSHA